MIFFLQYKQTFKEIVKIYGIMGLWFIILRNNMCIDALQVVKLLKENVAVWEPSKGQKSEINRNVFRRSNWKTLKTSASWRNSRTLIKNLAKKFHFLIW